MWARSSVPFVRDEQRDSSQRRDRRNRYGVKVVGKRFSVTAGGKGWADGWTGGMEGVCESTDLLLLLNPLGDMNKKKKKRKTGDKTLPHYTRIHRGPFRGNDKCVLTRAAPSKTFAPTLFRPLVREKGVFLTCVHLQYADQDVFAEHLSRRREWRQTLHAPPGSSVTLGVVVIFGAGEGVKTWSN